MKYRLVEIFKSLQGEGRNQGKRCVFVRFAGCNLACPWCDTDKTARFEASAEEIADEAEPLSCGRVVLTGGEPAAVPGVEELVAELKKRGFWIAVETNGTVRAQWFAFVDYVACSPKAEYPESLVLEEADEVRVVASSEDAAAFCSGLEKRISATDWYVSPCERDGKIDFAAAKSVLAKLGDRWALSVQLHKILGFR